MNKVFKKLLVFGVSRKRADDKVSPVKRMYGMAKILRRAVKIVQHTKPGGEKMCSCCYFAPYDYE